MDDLFLGTVDIISMTHTLPMSAFAKSEPSGMLYETKWRSEISIIDDQYLSAGAVNSLRNIHI